MSLKAFSHLLHYRHKKLNDTSFTNGLYEHGGLTCHSMWTLKGIDSGGEIARGKGGHSVGSVSLQEDIHRSDEKNKELLH